MDADQALAAVFALNDRDLSSLSGDSSDISADSTDLWLSSDSSADEDGDSDDTPILTMSKKAPQAVTPWVTV